ncbi:MAG: hypothetical protein L0Y36_07965 [Planctomycetales bacterium]|nr:hypothetical protein [Planctomycetales bacterium]
MNELTHTPGTPGWFKPVLFAGMLLFAFYASTHMVAAGDTWVALACGRHFVQHGVDTVEPFSFNSHPAGPSEQQLERFPAWMHGLIRYWHPTGWINQNWLTHLIYYKLATWFGDENSPDYNTLVYWKFAIYFLTVFCVYGTGKLLGAGDMLSAAAACMAMVVGRSFFDIRPAGYSNLLVPVYILVLALATYRNWRLIWLMIPLIVFWANVHGGYIYAFIMFVPFIGIHLLLRLPRRWSLCLGFIGLWAVLYLMSHKFITHEYYLTVQNILTSRTAEPVSLPGDKMFGILAFLAVVSFGATLYKKAPAGLFYGYHFAASGIYFLSLFVRFLPGHPKDLTPYFEALYSYFVSSSLLTFCIVFTAGMLLIPAIAFKKERFIVLPVRGLMHAAAAAVCAFIAMVVFNPFHLTNLTHTFEISVSKHAESWRQVNEWKPAFDWMDKTTTVPNPVGDEEAFGVLCILTAAALLVWLIAYFLKPRPAAAKAGRKQIQRDAGGAFERPRIDLAILAISLLTIYMAVQSRRFIANAGSAAAPAVFLMMHQAWQMLIARIPSKDKGRLDAPFVRRAMQVGYGTLAIALLGMGLFWGIKFKQNYLDPWPGDNRYHSIFMRMTASHLKPFEVCEFINANHLQGRVFNYWTEGGAVAFGEKPDSQTGQTPLQLFMDGRAQAAYNHDMFRLWQTIHSGGPVVQQAQIDGRKLTADQIQTVGSWIDEQLKSQQVWVVLMPQSQEDSTFMQGLQSTPNWKTGFIDNTQHLLVDIETPSGKALIGAILNDTAVFPDSFSKNLTTSLVIYENRDASRANDLYSLTQKAFAEYPYPTAAIAMSRLAGLPELRKAVADNLQSYLDDFMKNENIYQNENGFLLRLGSAEIAANSLARLRPQERSRYQPLAQQLREASKTLNFSRIW